MGTIGDIAGWLEQEVYRLGVEVRLSTYLDAADILAEPADAVIVAIGADLEPSFRQIQFPADGIVQEAGARIISSIELFTERGVDRGPKARWLSTRSGTMRRSPALNSCSARVSRSPSSPATRCSRPPSTSRCGPSRPSSGCTPWEISRCAPAASWWRRARGASTSSLSSAARDGDFSRRYGGLGSRSRRSRRAGRGDWQTGGAHVIRIGDALAGRNLQTAIREERHLAADRAGASEPANGPATCALASSAAKQKTPLDKLSTHGWR